MSLHVVQQISIGSAVATTALFAFVYFPRLILCSSLLVQHFEFIESLEASIFPQNGCQFAQRWIATVSFPAQQQLINDFAYAVVEVLLGDLLDFRVRNVQIANYHLPVFAEICRGNSLDWYVDGVRAIHHF